MNYKKMSFVSGIIIFFSLIFFLISVIWLSGRNIFLSNDYMLYFEFSDVAGIRDNSPVFMRGYKIGSTKTVQFKKDSIQIKVNINKKFQIPDDSKVEINTLNILGEKAITINPGSSDSFIKPLSVVQGQNKDIMILVKDTIVQIRQKIDEGLIESEIEKVSKSIDSFNVLVQNVDKRVNKLDIAMYNKQIEEVGMAGKHMTDFLTAAQQDLQKISIKSNSSFEKIDLAILQSQTTLQRLSDLVSEINKITGDINMGKGTVGELLHNREYIENLNKTMLRLEEFLDDIKKNPKKYFKFSIF